MFKSLFGTTCKYYGTKTFTYYLPAPPARKSGYQEKEFDHIIHSLKEQDYELINFQLSAHASEEKSGVWIVCHIGAKNRAAFEANISFSKEDDIPLGHDIIHD